MEGNLILCSWQKGQDDQFALLQLFAKILIESNSIIHLLQKELKEQFAPKKSKSAILCSLFSKHYFLNKE